MILSTYNGVNVLPMFLLGILTMLPLAVVHGQTQAEMFFREDWTETPPATPINQNHVANEDLVLRLYGPGADQIKKSHHEVPADDPFYLWSGRCEGNWAVTLQKKDANVDLSERAYVTWRAKQSGMRCLYLIVKLAGGQWLVSDQCDGRSTDWRVRQMNIDDITWRSLDIEEVIEGRVVEEPDLSDVMEIGVTDLMRGGGSAASSRLDWIEVYGKSVD